MNNWHEYCLLYIQNKLFLKSEKKHSKIILTPRSGVMGGLI